MTPNRLLRILADHGGELSLAEVVTIEHKTTGKLISREVVRRAMSELNHLGAVQYREITGATRMWSITPEGKGMVKVAKSTKPLRSVVTATASGRAERAPLEVVTSPEEVSADGYAHGDPPDVVMPESAPEPAVD